MNPIINSLTKSKLSLGHWKETKIPAFLIIFSSLSFFLLHLHASKIDTIYIFPVSTSSRPGPFLSIEILVHLIILPNFSQSWFPIFSFNMPTNSPTNVSYHCTPFQNPSLIFSSAPLLPSSFSPLPLWPSLQPASPGIPPLSFHNLVFPSYPPLPFLFSSTFPCSIFLSFAPPWPVFPLVSLFSHVPCIPSQSRETVPLKSSAIFRGEELHDSLLPGQEVPCRYIEEKDRPVRGRYVCK